MNSGNFPILPPDDFEDLQGGHLNEDPDSEENVLSSIDLPSVEEIHDFGEVARLDNLILHEVRSILMEYGWENTGTISTEEFLELCGSLNIEPDVLMATVAIEDLGFAIEKKNYDARALSRSVTVEDIEDQSNADNLENRQETATMEACLKLNDFICDPLLEKYRLLDKRVELTKKIDETRAMRAENFEEYEERERARQDLRAEQQEIEKDLEELLGIEAVTIRRERAIRRMGWLAEQEYLREAIEDFKSHYKTLGITPTFSDLAEALAGKQVDVFSAATNTDHLEGESEARVQSESVPGIVDKLIQEHLASMSKQAGKTNIDRENEAFMLQRLMQAKGICINVFQNDLEDGIYSAEPISKSDYKMLRFINRRLYIHADDEILAPFLSFMPGSNLRNIDIGEREEVPLIRFSGRSTKDIFDEVDTIIDNHPMLDRTRIESGIRALEETELGPEELYSLLADAYRVLEKLVYKEKHSARTLISP